MAFHVGQKVICVAAPDGRTGWRDSRGAPADGPAVGEKYTIIGFDNHPMRGIYVAEYRRPDRTYLDGTEIGFDQSRFRPIVERKTDISFAHEILRKAKAPARTLAFASPLRESPNSGE